MSWNQTASALAVSPSRRRRPGPPSRRGTELCLFLADDLGWRDTGCYGTTFYDAAIVAGQEGMRFTAAYAACPVCTPRVASIMTGKYPARLGTTYYFGAGAGNPPRNWR